MSNQTSFAINAPEVVSEVIDGELVAIHLGSGCYYHSNSTGSYIWHFLANGASQEATATAYAKQYSFEILEAKKTVDSFCKKLLTEDLIREQANTEITPFQINHLDEKNFPTLPYEEPTLKKHEDMKELLLLDPIHDVGEKAWPLTTVQ